MENIKSYKLFEQDMSDTQYHIRLIKDLFSDVIDEFGADEYTPDMTDVGLTMPTGIYYQVSQKPNSYRIKVWMSNMVNGFSKQSVKNKEIKMSKVVNDFERRLISAGYKIDRKKYVSWYVIEISYKR